MGPQSQRNNRVTPTDCTVFHIPLLNNNAPPALSRRSIACFIRFAFALLFIRTAMKNRH